MLYKQFCKRSCITTAVLLCLTLGCVAQERMVTAPNVFSFMGIGEIVAQAVEPALTIYKQSFSVVNRDTRQVFGIDEKDYFAYSYSLSINTSKGVLVTDRGMRPWHYSSDYQEIKKQFDFMVNIPLIASIDTVTIFEEADFNIESSKDIADSVAYFLSPMSRKEFMLEVSSVSNSKQGWMVWVIADSVTSDFALKPTISVIPYSIATTPDSVLYSPAPKNKTNRDILGGIYVTAKVLSTGVIGIQLSAVAVIVDNNWQLLHLWSAGKKEECKSEILQDRHKPILTPINQTKPNHRAKRRK